MLSILNFSRRLGQTLRNFIKKFHHPTKVELSILSLWLGFCSFFFFFVIILIASWYFALQISFHSCHWRKAGLEGRVVSKNLRESWHWQREQTYRSCLFLLLFQIACRAHSFLLRRSSSCCSFWPNSLFHYFCAWKVPPHSLQDRIWVQRLV